MRTMHCPGCGTEDNTDNRYCRICGSDLNVVRTALSMPDAITDSAVSARQEIGRALAARIRSAKSGELSTIAEEVLPEIEKFLESPAERRLRRLRYGMVTGFIGLGVAVAFMIAQVVMDDEGIIIVAGMGLVTFAIGLAMIINGLFLSVPKRELADRSEKGDTQIAIEGEDPNTSDLLTTPPAHEEFTSVTEGTTRHLKKEAKAERKSD